jgi:hypothetical protein
MAIILRKDCVTRALLGTELTDFTEFQGKATGNIALFHGLRAIRVQIEGDQYLRNTLKGG